MVPCKQFHESVESCQFCGNSLDEHPRSRSCVHGGRAGPDQKNAGGHSAQWPKIANGVSPHIERPLAALQLEVVA